MTRVLRVLRGMKRWTVSGWHKGRWKMSRVIGESRPIHGKDL